MNITRTAILVLSALDCFTQGHYQSARDNLTRALETSQGADSATREWIHSCLTFVHCNEPWTSLSARAANLFDRAWRDYAASTLDMVSDTVADCETEDDADEAIHNACQVIYYNEARLILNGADCDLADIISDYDHRVRGIDDCTGAHYVLLTYIRENIEPWLELRLARLMEGERYQSAYDLTNDNGAYADVEVYSDDLKDSSSLLLSDISDLDAWEWTSEQTIEASIGGRMTELRVTGLD